jgi:fructan beta-fructosidase
MCLSIVTDVSSDGATDAGPAHREVTIQHRYFHLPVRNGAAKQRMKLSVEGRTIREFEIELAEGNPDFWVFADLDGHQGKTLRIDVDKLPPGAQGLATIAQGDEIPNAAQTYQEALRPQFHFTSRRGWHNDPNGLTWQSGTYHLFYQHNPYSWSWGNMHWGHAVSRDLVHWKELPTALYPRQFGDWCFSGSAELDVHNTSGLQRGVQPPLVVAYTSTGRGECIAFSHDGGRHFQEYEGNPAVKHIGRDPKLIWYEPGKHWVMAVYDETGGRQGIAFYTSPDLKRWMFQSKIDGFFECPDLFELRIDGDHSDTRWVLHAADGKYVLGEFDGRAFHPTSGKDKLQVWYGNFYAAQSFSNEPHGRRIQIGWANGVAFPGMPFNQQMTVPVELSLSAADEGIRLHARPIRELGALRAGKHDWHDLKLSAAENPLREVKGELFEIQAEFNPATDAAFALDLRGTPLVYDPARHELACGSVKAPLKPSDGRIRLQVFLDRGSIEVFGNDGLVAMSVAAIPAASNRSLAATSRGGPTFVHSLVVHELRSAWDRP